MFFPFGENHVSILPAIEVNSLILNFQALLMPQAALILNRSNMKTIKLSFLVLLLLVSFGLLRAQKITILHTNDIHSRINGDGPQADYTPLIVNNGSGVLGGFARLATLLKQQKAKNPDGTLILDAGDFFMGSLFNPTEPDPGFQLSLMKSMGFQFTTIGNHEFDYGPNALADAIVAAKKQGGLPQIISSNLVPDPNSPKDNKLAALFENGTILPYKIITVKGVKIGIIGILGIDAADVAPLKAPVQVEKQIKTVKRLAGMLKKEKHVNLVICLSHSGEYPKGNYYYNAGLMTPEATNGNPDGDGFYGEDVKLAKKVKDLDIIISAHTHVVVPQPFKAGNTLIVQTGAFLHNLGRLDITMKNGKITGYDYKLIPINDKIKGDLKVNAKINHYIHQVIEKKFLHPLQLTYTAPVAETSFNLLKHNKNGYQYTDLGVFLADATRNYVNTFGGGTDVELLASGTVRDNIMKGKTGVVTVPDIFRVFPLGRENDSLPGYPLARIYITGHELKNLMEVLLLAKGDDSYVFVSGIKVYFNPKKLMLTRVYKIEMNGKPIDFSKKNPKLYSVTADTYLLSFIGRVKKLSHGLVNVVPKFKNGQPIHDMDRALIDFDPNKKGVQIGTEWLGVVRFMQHLKDTNGDGIPDVPLKYKPALSNRIAGKK